jgi:hypothetical protein
MSIKPRPHTRDDGILTRIDTQFWTAAERAIGSAMQEVEAAGASPALTDAATFLRHARDRVADHVEGIPAAQEYKAGALNPDTQGAKTYSQAEVDAIVAAAIDRDRIAGFMEFAKNLPDRGDLQARAIFRALMKAGF